MKRIDHVWWCRHLGVVLGVALSAIGARSAAALQHGDDGAFSQAEEILQVCTCVSKACIDNSVQLGGWLRLFSVVSYVNLQDAISKRVFPGAVAGVADANGFLWTYAVGSECVSG